MRGYFGLFCSFSPKLPLIHVGLHCNEYEKNNREKGYWRLHCCTEGLDRRKYPSVMCHVRPPKNEILLNWDKVLLVSDPKIKKVYIYLLVKNKLGHNFLANNYCWKLRLPYPTKYFEKVYTIWVMTYWYIMTFTRMVKF